MVAINVMLLIGGVLLWKLRTYILDIREALIVYQKYQIAMHTEFDERLRHIESNIAQTHLGLHVALGHLEELTKSKEEEGQ